MPRNVVRKEKGIFEREPGSESGIRYKIDAVKRREKVGRRGDAINLYKLYKVRKTDALRSELKLMILRNQGRTQKNRCYDT